MVTRAATRSENELIILIFSYANLTRLGKVVLSSMFNKGDEITLSSVAYDHLSAVCWNFAKQIFCDADGSRKCELEGIVFCRAPKTAYPHYDKMLDELKESGR